jgi:SAM-dependent methyltransferase
MTAATSINNYEYLDILDRAWRADPRPQTRADPPAGGVLYDVGCASFWYAGALQAFFRPARLRGVEVEGHRLFRDGRTRIDYARGYLADFPDAEFIVADYAELAGAADIISAWFPFLTPAAILAWRLPLSLLAPQRLFAQIRENLRPGGLFVMVNHGWEEAALAHDLCAAAGLWQVSSYGAPGVLSGHRALPAVLSRWQCAPVR